MRRSFRKALAVCAGALALLRVTASHADPAPLVSYQGILLAPDGSPRSGHIDLEIRLFSVPFGGTVLFTEMHADVPLQDGVFSIAIGSVQPLPIALFSSPGARWLELVVDPAGAPETLAPRQQLISVPYALDAANAHSVGGLSASEVAGTPGPVGGYLVVDAAFTGTSASASCPAGKLAVSGGCDCAASGTTKRSRPLAPRDWYCECSVATTGNRVYVACADSGAICGNGQVESGESCDGGATSCAGGACPGNCSCSCGNGVREGGEQCDGSNLGCPGPPGYVCTSACTCTCTDPDPCVSQVCGSVVDACGVTRSCGACLFPNSKCCPDFGCVPSTNPCP